MPATNPWDAARDLPVVRGNHLEAPAPLEPGVKFFILMLEQLGCTTEWSCEGHPTGFYIVFHGPERIARAVTSCGYFTVELNRCGGWHLSLIRNERPNGEVWTMQAHDECLRWAADAWVAAFGPIGNPAAPLVDSPRRDVLEAALQGLIHAANLAFDERDNPDEEIRVGFACDLRDAAEEAGAVLSCCRTVPAMDPIVTLPHGLQIISADRAAFAERSRRVREDLDLRP